MTRQEMFDKAVRGLRSQGFERAMGHQNKCVYVTEDGKHCAWGWVDESLWDGRGGAFGVESLKHDMIGLAASLSEDDVNWACQLQVSHDLGVTPKDMEYRLRVFAARFSLTWPE